MNLKGTLPTLILEALVKEPSHGYRIAQQIKERSQGILDFKEGTLYPALHKLERSKLIESNVQLVGSRKRREYVITSAGRKALEKEISSWKVMVRTMSVLLEAA